MVAEYRVELEAYNGPLDLLLYLLRREEVDIYDIPIARITARYLEYVELLSQIDPDVLSEFLVMAASLMEMKSRTLLPHAPEAEDDEDFADPRMELVRQLLEYKKFKDAAHELGTAAETAALKFPRHPAVAPTDRSEIDLEDVQLWDLVDAFRKILVETGQRAVTHDIVDDDTPIALHAADLVDSLERAGGIQLFESIFTGRTKAQLIGLFLALLELLRRNRIRASQETAFGAISIKLIDATPIEVDEERDYSYSTPPAEDDEEEPEATSETDEETADVTEPIAPAAGADADEPLADDDEPEARVELEDVNADAESITELDQQNADLTPPDDTEQLIESDDPPSDSAPVHDHDDNDTSASVEDHAITDVPEDDPPAATEDRNDQEPRP
ncbi:MAG: segregation/condensation protein A [bacterium]|nr:segregation/condensation protein A [bacterium]